MRARAKEALIQLGTRVLGPMLLKQEQAIDDIKLALGHQESRRLAGTELDRLDQAEFRVFSQWGEDGIIQYLIGRVEVEREFFVEIGVGDYSESNTRFLLAHDNWCGAIFDIGTQHVDFLETRELSWRHDVKGYSLRITRDNIDESLVRAGGSGDIGLLSIDVDGNDYWILEAMSVASPRLLVIEYNSIFGPDLPITVPYRADFDYLSAHHSGLYFGASLAALHHLGKERDYRLVGSNSAGNNAFFVRADVATRLTSLEPEEAYVRSRFRTSRDRAGKLTGVDPHTEGLRLIAHLPVVNVMTGESAPLAEFLGQR